MLARILLTIRDQLPARLVAEVVVFQLDRERVAVWVCGLVFDLPRPGPGLSRFGPQDPHRGNSIDHLDLPFAHPGQASIVDYRQLDSERALGAVLVFRVLLRAFNSIAELPMPRRDLAIVSRRVDELDKACHRSWRWRVVERRSWRGIQDSEGLADGFCGFACGIRHDHPHAERIPAQAHAGRVPHVGTGVGKASGDLVPLSPVARPVEVDCERVRGIVRVGRCPLDLMHAGPGLAARGIGVLHARRLVELECYWDYHQRAEGIVRRDVQIEGVGSRSCLGRAQRYHYSLAAARQQLASCRVHSYPRADRRYHDREFVFEILGLVRYPQSIGSRSVLDSNRCVAYRTRHAEILKGYGSIGFQNYLERVSQTRFPLVIVVGLDIIVLDDEALTCFIIVVVDAPASRGRI